MKGLQQFKHLLHSWQLHGDEAFVRSRQTRNQPIQTLLIPHAHKLHKLVTVNNIQFVSFEVITVATMKNAIFWNVTCGYC
jgi:hypothetical protein